MERTMSVEDKIRRAEEIYNRRRENENRTASTRVSVDKNNDYDNKKLNKKLKKMIIQIIVCMLIYLIFHYVINNNYVFSEDFRKKCEEILAYDISFSQTYEAIVNWINKIAETYQGILPQASESQGEESENQENSGGAAENSTQQGTESNGNNEVDEGQESQQNENDLNTEETNAHMQESIGGGGENVAQPSEGKETTSENIAEKETQGETSNTAEILTEEQQMQKDADEIKAKINFIKPLVGTITSRFGWRDPEVTTVSKYHTGIDIAANEGTDIIAATNVKVILASSEGAYGNHLKIQIEDVIIIYAHCLLLTVNEGDEITQGQKIAEVGSTGNSTGPHLHFEIRREDRYVNPDLILQF